jgi:hypothetical protein
MAWLCGLANRRFLPSVMYLAVHAGAAGTWKAALRGELGGVMVTRAIWGETGAESVGWAFEVPQMEVPKG